MKESLPSPPLTVIGLLMPLLSQPRGRLDRREHVTSGHIRKLRGAPRLVQLAHLDEVRTLAEIDGDDCPGVVDVDLVVRLAGVEVDLLEIRVVVDPLDRIAVAT